MKCIFILLLSLFLMGCSKKDELYYWHNPEKMKKAMASCPERKPPGVTCDKLTAIVTKFKYLANELKQNPQLFGLQIVTLQERISQKEQKLRKQSNKQLAASLSKDKKTLSHYLAIVSYFESPRGVIDEDFSKQ